MDALSEKEGDDIDKEVWSPAKGVEPELEDLMLEVHKEQKGVIRLEQTIEFKYWVRIPHNATHRVL